MRYQKVVVVDVEINLQTGYIFCFRLSVLTNGWVWVQGSFVRWVICKVKWWSEQCPSLWRWTKASEWLFHACASSALVLTLLAGWHRGHLTHKILCFLSQISSLPSVLWRCGLGGRKGIRPAKTEWWGAGMVVCLERGADLHMTQLMPLPLTVSCFSKVQIDFTFLVPAHPGSPGQRAIKLVCVCVCIAYICLQTATCGRRKPPGNQLTQAHLENSR